MNVQAKIQTAPVSSADVLAVLDRRLKELVARRAIVVELIIKLEKAGGTAESAISADVEQAQALLDGEKFAARPKPFSALSALQAEQATIDSALKIGRSRQHRLMVERATEIWREHFPLIAEIEK